MISPPPLSALYFGNSQYFAAGANGVSDFQGDFSEYIWSDTTTGYLDFAFRFDTRTYSAESLNSIQLEGFAGVATTVAQFNAPSPYSSKVGTSSVNRSLDGDTVTMDWPLAPNTTSYGIVFFTNVQSYQQDFMIVKSDSASNYYSIYLPQAVPEPVSFLTVGFGVFALAWRTCRKR